ncbi:universal stress protein [Haloechinothrix sp. LS1_15]|nr:universal stress protein [Haloechinothrix sp. LS1_15]
MDTAGTQPPVVAGVDGSDSALEAVRWAAREAQRRAAPLRLVHAYSVPALPPCETAAVVAAFNQQGSAWLDAARAVAEEAAPGSSPSCVTLAGSGAERLVAESQDAELVVVGSRGLGGFAEQLVGSVAVALATYGACPVVVVRSATEHVPVPTRGPVVVGVDGSAAGDGPLAFAFDTAARLGAQLVAVHTWSDLTQYGAWNSLGGATSYEERYESKRAELTGWLAGWREKYPDVGVTEIVLRDRPVRGLLDTAAHAGGVGAQLLVIGSRGPAPATGMTLGSTSWSLLHYAECPLAVVRVGLGW